VSTQLQKTRAVLIDASLDPDTAQDALLKLQSSQEDRGKRLDHAAQFTAEIDQVGSWLIAKKELGDFEQQVQPVKADIQAVTNAIDRHKKWHEHISTLAVFIGDARRANESSQLNRYAPTINTLYQR